MVESTADGRDGRGDGEAVTGRAVIGRVVIGRAVIGRAGLGAMGEQVAVDHLLAAGFEVVERNWRCRLGEIDVVAREGAVLVAVEVKTRRSGNTGHPLEAITPAKVARLRALLARWLATHDLRAPHVRLDAVAVLADGRSAPRVEHVRGIGW